MPSKYNEFYVQVRDEFGTITAVGAGVEVHAYDTDAEADVTESPLETDSDGKIAADEFADVDPGTKIIFRIENHNGMSGCEAQITQEI